jgi:transposase-like protein
MECPRCKSSAVETIPYKSRIVQFDAHSCQDCGHEWDTVGEAQ